ncbi:MAG TPA: O-antigen ligase family protein [Verrucomicrobiae bacterium]
MSGEDWGYGFDYFTMSFEGVKRRIRRFREWLTEWLIYFAIVFGPWAFGTTQEWSIRVMNCVGYALGLMVLVKPLLRSRGRRSLRWESLSAGNEPVRWQRRERQFTRLLGLGTCCILLYCLISAWNARVIYHPNEWSFEYRNAITWLPHSYDQAASWDIFWQYLGLAGFFWGLRDWLLTLTPKEAERFQNEGSPSQGGSRLPVRLRRLFWVLAVNGTVLAIQGLVQRCEGGYKLLWVVVPRLHISDLDEFGPYAYRSNAAQYFNMLWPAVLGFWWAYVSSPRRKRAEENVVPRNHVGALLPCALIMAICPIVSSSRGGAIVLGINLILAAGIFMVAKWRSRWTTKAMIFLLAGTVIGGGALLGWKALAPRLEKIHEGYEDREGVFVAGRYMADDNPVFGLGPGSFDTMYQLYRRSEADEWQAYMHNDWLQTLITFGWVGGILIGFAGVLTLSHWFWSGGINGNKFFVMLLWMSLGGCLVHARFDFPFQVHSVLALFLVICAVLSCLSRRQLI